MQHTQSAAATVAAVEPVPVPGLNPPGPLTAQDFDRFARESSARLLSVIKRYCRNDRDAEDVLQETFLAAWKARADFDGRSTMSTWMHRIAINTSLNKLRANKTLRALLDTDLSRPDSPRDNPLEQAAVKLSDEDRSALRELVWGVIDELPADQRTVLVLRDVEGLSSEEVAGQLAISDAAVRQRLHRARKVIAERLQPELCGAGDMTCGGRLDLLLDYIDGLLSAEYFQPVTQHVAACPTCQHYAAAYRKTKALPGLTALTEEPVPPQVLERLLATVHALN